jgi:hypothetical protein
VRQFRLPGECTIDDGQFMDGIPVHEQRKTLIRRRDLLLAVTISGAVVAVGTASSPTPTQIRRDKRKPQYQPNSAEVQTFYRVNRYPVK